MPGRAQKRPLTWLFGTFASLIAALCLTSAHAQPPVKALAQCLRPASETAKLSGALSEATRIAVIYPSAWEQRELLLLSNQNPGLELSHVGGFTDTWRLLCGAAGGNLDCYFDAMVNRLARQGVDGAIGSQDFPSSIFAAEINTRLGATTPTTESLLLLTHKYLSREIQAGVHPEAVPPFQVVNPRAFDPAAVTLQPPFFAKPVKGTSSVKTYQIDDVNQLGAAMQNDWKDALVHGSLSHLYNRILASHLNTPIDARHFLLEGLLRGDQVTVDGYVLNGVVHIRGTVDSIMYPGTTSFARFQYPSQLPPAVLQYMETVSADVVRAAGLDNSSFNVEFFYDAASGESKIIEVNPRLAIQFADLHEKVDGVNLFEDALALVTGNAPQPIWGEGSYDVAASFVLRKFPGQRVVSFPSRAKYREVQAAHPEWRITLFRYDDPLRALLDDPKSQLMGYFNLGAKNQAELELRYERLLDELGIVIQ